MKKNIFFYFLLTCSLLFTILVSTPANAQETKFESNTNNINNSVNTGSLLESHTERLSTDLYVEYEPSIQVFSQNGKSLDISDADIEFMAKVVHAESKGEPYTGKVAVASVILNRVIDPNFPNTIHGVITQKNAFSCVRNGVVNATPNSDSYNAVMDAIKGNDPTNKALYFYNPDIATCNWMHGVQKKNVQSIGRHVFFEV